MVKLEGKLKKMIVAAGLLAACNMPIGCATRTAYNPELTPKQHQKNLDIAKKNTLNNYIKVAEDSSNPNKDAVQGVYGVVGAMQQKRNNEYKVGGVVIGGNVASTYVLVNGILHALDGGGNAVEAIVEKTVDPGASAGSVGRPIGTP